MAIEATPAQLPLVAARLLLAAFYFYFMLGLTFGAAVRTNLLLIARLRRRRAAGPEFAPSVAIYSLFVLFSANLIGGAGCYALEYANRIAFLERRRLADVAMHDGLTGLLNRAALEEQARGAVAARAAGAAAGVGAADRYRSLQGLQRPLRAPGRRWLPEAGRHRDPQQRRSAARWTWWRATAARRSSPSWPAATAPMQRPGRRRGAQSGDRAGHRARRLAPRARTSR